MIWLGIDGTNWCHAIWHAMGASRTLDGMLRVFSQRLETLTNPENKIFPTAVLVAFDRRSFRHDLLPEYKAHRAKKDPDLNTFLAAAPAACVPHAHPVYQDGYEADDLLATLAALAVTGGARAILATPDKDLWQCLVAGRVSVLRSFGSAAGKLVDHDWFTATDLGNWPKKEPYHLQPAQWADFQALVGEAGDNVPGCPAWGEKTSARALAKHASIADMLKDPWSVACTPKQLASLQTWAKTKMPTVLDCVRLRTDVPCVRDALR